MLRKMKHISRRAIVRVCAAALSCVLLMGLLPVAGRSLADTVQYGTVIVGSANVRDNPGTVNTNVIDVLGNGARVIVGDVVTVPNDPSGSTVWCQVTYSNSDGTLFKGYIVDAFLAKDADNSADAAFESEIAAFPESYKIYLRALHKNHPNWHFVPVNVARSFDDTAALESRLGVSLIENSVNDAWKSTDSGAYDWKTGTYTPYDGKTWVNASKAVVMHYLDPRNQLSEENVFQFLELSYNPSYHTIDTVQAMLNGTFMQSQNILNLNDVPTSFAQTFCNAAALSGANPVFLAAKVVQEVSPTGSNSVSGNYYSSYYKKQYTGLYNYFNIGAYSSPDPVANGLAFARDGYKDANGNSIPAKNDPLYLPWTSPYRSIIGGSIFVANSYINIGQNTIYQMKFNIAPKDSTQFGNHQYMTNVRGAASEGQKMYKAYSKAGLINTDLHFLVPVYSGLPANPCGLPRESGSPNAYLKYLSVDGYVLTPQSNPMECADYSLVVPASCSSIHIEALPASDKATVAGAGDVALGEGVTTISIVCTAQSGVTKTYTLTVAKNTAAYDNYFTTTLPNNEVFFGGISPESSVGGVKGLFTVKDGYSLTYTNMNGQPKDDSALISTGDLVEILDSTGAVVYVGAVFIRGDANCDGKISSADLTIISRYILGVGTLTDAGKCGADANKDGKVSAADLTLISRYILKLSTITQ